MNGERTAPEITLRGKVGALFRVGKYRPALTSGIIGLSVFAAVLEGIGLSFLIPVIEIAQGTTGGSETSTVVEGFVAVYETLGVPFTLEWVMAGVGVVMVVRYTASFCVQWLQVALRTYYVRHLQSDGFDSALGASVAYYDDHGSDEVLNAIITQTGYAGQTIRNGVNILQQVFLSLMYLTVALYLAPWMTLLTGLVLGVLLVGLRHVLESGYAFGTRVADANERVQSAVQAGTQGIREAKLFGLTDELFEDFRSAVDQFTKANILLRRNQALLDNAYQMFTAVTVFGLIYVALTLASLSLSSLGVFLFAMFRLAPRVSNLNDAVYTLDGQLPHLVRTQAFLEDLRKREERDEGTLDPPESVNRIAFENVTFSYDADTVLDGVSFDVSRGEFVAFVGPSGAGKSTIVAMLARLYVPDSGRITADGTPIDQFDLGEWRTKLSVVRQDPHIFDDTLRYNVTVGNRGATEADIREACELAQVTEFFDELPDGLDTDLGDDGVRLSGGQRQRVAIARALLCDADVLVLDEATSNLDSTIEERVHRNVEETDRELAMIVIAHRLSTVVNADRIYSMEAGRISEVGPHHELVEADGTYAELYATQTQEG